MVTLVNPDLLSLAICDLFQALSRRHACRANVARISFCELRTFLMEKCSEIFSEFLEPLFCGGLKNSGQNSRQMSQQNIKKNHRRDSAGAQGEGIAENMGIRTA